MKSIKYWGAFIVLVSYTVFCVFVSICGMVALLEPVYDASGRVVSGLLSLAIITIGTLTGGMGAMLTLEKVGIINALNK